MSRDREDRGELSEAIKMFLSYANNKGLIPNALELYILKLFHNVLRKMNINIPDFDLDEFIRISINQPAYHGYPLWAMVVKDVAKGLQHKTEVIEMKRKKTPVENL